MPDAKSRQARVPLDTAAREVTIANRHPQLRLNSRSVARVFAVLDANSSAVGLATSAVPKGELSIVFLTDRELAKLHAEFLDDPSTTDVITFEGDPLLNTAGEICVSADMAATYAQAHDRDFSTELTLYLVHGWLHLAGHDDLVPAKKRSMRRAEARAMRILQSADAVPAFALRAQK